MLKGASATVLDVAAWGKVREKKLGCEVENTPMIGGKREGNFGGILWEELGVSELILRGRVRGVG